ncbi:MAG: 5-(carboxyamino)imidazole ribonucleotide synthase [Phycisphaeraceae bacterium]|nr:MAG: 5-(carboxyamino)imidazole ribonucleotide synthase [Phycisphaeraceae bacterium]
MSELRLGVLGGGQLALMLAQAASSLGVSVRTFDESSDAPAARITDHRVGRFDDDEAIARFADGCDAVTCEFENVPASTLEAASRHAPVRPNPTAFAIAQDRALERGLFSSLGIPTTTWVAVGSPEDLDRAIETVGFPMILKTRRMGYDGKGQCLVRSPEEAWTQGAALLASAPGGLIADRMATLRAEVSVVAVRSADGQVAKYPLCQNEHRHGILWRTQAPAPIGEDAPEIVENARAAALRVLHAIDYVGVMAIEFFVEGENGALCLLANEMAPRVHNTGHWTIEGASTSQFENHVRAVLGLPLGSTMMTTPEAIASMYNIVGRVPARGSLLAVPDARVHLYGKPARRARKLGHVTLVGTDARELSRRETIVEELCAWDV